MTTALLAAFATPAAITAAAKAAREGGAAPLDAFTPFPIAALNAPLGVAPPRVGWWMLGGGLTFGLGVLGLEFWSVFYGYVYDSGGRPLDSWPAFLIPAVEFAILFAALTGFVTLLRRTGLPRLNHPLFDRPTFERASQDQFVLALPLGERARELAFAHGAVWVEEAEL